MVREVTGVLREQLEQDATREGREQQINKSVRERRGQRDASGVHEVRRARSKSRTQEAASTHEVKRGPVKRWQRASALPALPDPPGYSLCYISRHNRHRGDEAGLIAALQEGWEFARKSDFPEHVLPTQSLASHGEVIGNDTTVLMKLPLELKAQRDAYYNDKRDDATRAVNRKRPGLPEATPQMPLVEDRNDVSQGLHRDRRRRERAAEA